MRMSLLIALLLVSFLGCSEELWVPAPEAVISLGASGGFAGVAWGVTIDGGTGLIVGGDCDRQLDCDWEPGETLGSFDGTEFQELTGRFARRGFLQLEEDYGVECCDQFYFVLGYADQERQHTVAGSSERLPRAVSELVDAVMQFVAQHRSTGG